MSARPSPGRSPRDVFEDHLALSRVGSVETDLERNYAPDVVILTGFGTYYGRSGMRDCWRKLLDELPEARFEYRTKLVEGEVALLEWAAESAIARVGDGADSFVIRDGLIVAQTIHYTLEPSAGRMDGLA